MSDEATEALLRAARASKKVVEDIRKIAAAVEEIKATGLTERGLIVLIADKGRIPKGHIKDTLDALGRIEEYIEEYIDEDMPVD